MRISAGCDYACRALLELALHWPSKEPVQISTIAKKQDIPIKYLEQILIELKNIDIVESVRGKQGGYRLVKDPRKIRLGDVMRQIGGPLLPVADTAAKRESVFANIWREAEEAVAGVLDKINFEDIANKAKGMEGTVIYQI